MKLYAANLSKANYVFHFRLPEVISVVAVEIPANGQAFIHEDSPEIIEMIIQQHQRYGFTPLHEAVSRKMDRTKTPLVYSEKPFSWQDIYDLERGRGQELDQAAQKGLQNEAASMHMREKETANQVADQRTVDIIADPVRVQDGDNEVARPRRDMLRMEVDQRKKK